MPDPEKLATDTPGAITDEDAAAAAVAMAKRDAEEAKKPAKDARSALAERLASRKPGAAADDKGDGDEKTDDVEKPEIDAKADDDKAKAGADGKDEKKSDTAAKKDDAEKADKGNKARERIRELRGREKAAQAEIAALKARLAAAPDGSAAEAAAERAWIAKVKKDPSLLFAEGVGLELREISEAYLKSVDPETRQRLETDGRIKALEQERDREKAEREKVQAQAGYQQQVTEVREIIGADKDRWELVNRDKGAPGVILGLVAKRVAKLKAEGEHVDLKRIKRIVAKVADKHEKRLEEKGKLYTKGSGSSTSPGATKNNAASSDKSTTLRQEDDARPQRVRPNTITSDLRGRGGGGAQPQREGGTARERLNARIAARRASA